MTLMNKVYFFIFCWLLVVASCQEDNGSESALTLMTDKALVCDARCQYQTIAFSTEEKWTLSSDADWITIRQKEGVGTTSSALYIQQNDERYERRATVSITTSSGKSQTVSIVQQLPDENGAMIEFTKTFGLGWGYDLKEDLADVNGIRGQVFDIEALSNDYEDNVINVDNHTITKTQYAYGYSHQELETEMGTKVSASINLKVARATVSAEYSEQIKEQKDRLYIWWRDMRLVKKTYFSNDVNFNDKSVIDWCTTSAFRNSCKNDTPADLVKKFGTHLIVVSDLGGKFDYYFTLSSDVKEKIESLVTTVSVKILGFKKNSTSVNEKTWTDVKRDFKGKFYVEGGGIYGTRLNNALNECISQGTPIADERLFDNWFNCFSNIANIDMANLTMVDFEVIPIWDIVSIRNSEKGKDVREYITKNYLQ